MKNNLRVRNVLKKERLLYYESKLKVKTNVINIFFEQKMHLYYVNLCLKIHGSSFSLILLVPLVMLQNIDWNNDIFYDRSESYRKWFKLTGISKMRDGYKAFINNEIMSEGDRIRGFVVKKITEKKVVLKKNNSSVTLRL